MKLILWFAIVISLAILTYAMTRGDVAVAVIFAILVFYNGLFIGLIRKIDHMRDELDVLNRLRTDESSEQIRP